MKPVISPSPAKEGVATSRATSTRDFFMVSSSFIPLPLGELGVKKWRATVNVASRRVRVQYTSGTKRLLRDRVVVRNRRSLGGPAI